MSSRVLGRFSLGLPLVARELIQMASRRRTYLLRVFYALTLFATAGFIYFDQIRFSLGNSTWGLLGSGGQLLEAVATVQILGTWLFLPAMVAPALALEKERQTLPLLFVTRLGPITLLLEKLVGTFRYLLRVLILLEVPVLVASVLALAKAGNPFPEPVSVVQILTWFLIILIISARVSTLFSGERSRQTLEILLSTPLSTRDLVRQKHLGVHRMILVLSVPLLTAVAIATYWRFEFRELFWQRSGYISHNGSNDHHPLCYMTCGVLAVLIYPRMMAWLALWIGLVCKSPARATIVSTVAIVAWCGIPALLVAWMETEYSMFRNEWIGWMFLTSPAAIITLNEFSEFRLFSRGMNPWLATAVNFTLYGLVTLFFRNLCLNASSYWLKRPE